MHATNEMRALWELKRVDMNECLIKNQYTLSLQNDEEKEHQGGSIEGKSGRGI